MLHSSMVSNYQIVLDYAHSIVYGSKAACVELQQACQRFLSDLDDPQWDFRVDRAESVVQLIETQLCHVKAELR